MEYRVRWFDVEAQVVREESTDASSKDAAVRLVTSAGASVLSVSRVHTRAKPTFQDFDVSWWCRELRTLLMAGMTVVEALDTLHAQPLGQARATIQGALVSQLRQGRALSAAMSAGGVFPPVLVAGVKGSERTGALVPALEDFLRYHEMLERLRKQVVSAAIYPALVVAVGGAISLFLLLFVIPRFSQMYGSLHGSVSITTRALLAISHFLAAHRTLAAALLAAAAVGLVAAWRAGVFRVLALGLIEAIPSLSRQADQFRLAKLYQALAVMFRGGYALDEALGHCENLGLGDRLSARVVAARDALARGQRVSISWSEAGLADAVSQRLLAVGERTGNFDRVLMTIAERHASNFTTFVERVTRIVEPVLLLLVALLVGGIVIAMYMPVFDIASSVG